MADNMTIREQIIEKEMNLRNEIAGIKIENNQEVICKEYLKYNMFVEAGAGAGKTFTIVQRVLNQLCIGMKPGEIVVITFTNKAAEELRGRISKGIRERIYGKSADKYAQYEKELKYALSHMDDMNISTIHSFCFKLLNERCFDAKLPMDLGLLDNEMTTEQKDSIFEEWISGLDFKDWRLLQDNDPNNRRRYDIKKEIKDIYDKVCTMPAERHVHIENSTINPSADALYKGLVQILVNTAQSVYSDSSINSMDAIFALDDISDLFLGARFVKNGVRIDEKDDAGNIDYRYFWYSLLAKDISDCKKGEEIAYTELKSTKLLKKPKALKGKKLGKKELDNISPYIESGQEDLQEYINQHIDEINALINKDIVEYRNTINSYAEKARQYYCKVKSLTELTNDALLEYTRDMIVGSDEAQKYFSNKYSCFYVDEFQDTDTIQETFIWRLASETNNVDKLRDGALFIVGDPKQSIYRFRGADPDVYINVKARMKAMEDAGENTRVYNLQINFRSNDLIIKWVNDKFSATTNFEPIMVAKNNAPAYVYQNMIAKKVLPDNLTSVINDDEYSLTVRDGSKGYVIAGVYQYDMPEEGSTSIFEKYLDLQEADKSRKQTLNLEAEDMDKQNLVDLILNLCNNEKYKIIDDGKVRNIIYSDFLVLCAAKSRMSAYLDYLTLRGIPVQIAGETKNRSSMEVNAFVRIYNCLANRKDQLARISAIEAFRCLGVSDIEDEVDHIARVVMDRMYDECKGMSAYGMAMYLLKHLSVVLKKNRELTAFETVSVQTKLIQMIETVCKNEYGAPKDIAKKFNEYLDVVIEHELSLEEKIDAVRFMNIHKSKGLEGNIVVIVDRKGKTPSVSNMLVDNEFYPRPKQFKDLHEAEKKELSSERRRLEYVTATRAGQALIFFNSLSKEPLFSGQDGSMYELANLDTIAPVVLENAPHGEPQSGSFGYNLEQEIAEYTECRSSQTEKDVVPGCQRISPSNFESGKSPTKKEALHRAYASGMKVEDEYSKSLTRPVGNILGNALHRAMELMVDRYKALSKIDDEMRRENAIEACAKQAVFEGLKDISCGEVDTYVTFVSSCAKAYFKELVKLGWLDEEGTVYHTELPFSYYEFNTDGDDIQYAYAKKHKEKLKKAPVWMNGSADLVIRKNADTKEEEIIIIDYKSDNDYCLKDIEFDKSMSEKYIGQLDNYRYAMKKLFGIDYDKITMKVVSFSQKDLSGKVYDDKTVRIRITTINESE